jgi:DNA (cytosine-5)-methyltransferase 1
MSKLRVMELFSGYGSQRMALRNLGIDFESVGISEIDIPAILSYASIHDGLDVEDETFEYPTKEEMIKFLESKNIGLDFKNGKVKLPKNLDKLKQIYRATVLSKCFGDVSLLKLSELPDVDFVTYSFPCTDISVAGQQKGIKKGQTRSGLLYECEKIIEEKRPKYLLMENVKNLVGKKFKEQFDKWLSYLESLGYKNYWQVLNAKDYKVPQNRERVFVVSILGEHDGYTFPQKQRLDIRLKDVLESQVEGKYYLSDEIQARFTPFPSNRLKNSDISVLGTTAPNPRGINGELIYDKSTSAWVYDVDKCVGTLSARDYKQPKQITEEIIEVGILPYEKSKKKHQSNTVYDSCGVNPTLTACDYKSPTKIIQHDIDYVIGENYVEYVGVGHHPNSKKKEFNGYHNKECPCLIATDYKAPKTIMERIECIADEVKNIAEKMRNEEIGITVKDNFDIRPHRLDVKKSGLSELNINCDENCSHIVTTTHSPKTYGLSTNYRIRKLTPLECWRLMGCSDEDYYKAKRFNSDSQLYKQAGNSIVVNVLEGIFANMFCENNQSK